MEQVECTTGQVELACRVQREISSTLDRGALQMQVVLRVKATMLLLDAYMGI